MRLHVFILTIAVLFHSFFGVVKEGLAADKIKVVTTTTDLAWAVQQIGGDLVEVEPLLTGNENAHYVDAVPKFIQLVANADVVCMIGMDLEIGWIPKVLAKSGNARVQSGGPGYCEVGKRVHAMEKPKGPVDRSMGDIHPAGNPHFWLSPHEFGHASQEIYSVLSGVAPNHVQAFSQGYEKLQAQLKDIQTMNRKRIVQALGKNPKVAQYHSNFTYYFAAMNIENLGTVEEIPGQHPSAGRLAQFGMKMKQKSAAAVLAVDYDPEKVLNRFQQISGVPVVMVADSIRPADSSLSDYGKLISKITDTFIAKAKTAQKGP